MPPSFLPIVEVHRDGSISHVLSLPRRFDTKEHPQMTSAVFGSTLISRIISVGLHEQWSLARTSSLYFGTEETV